MTLVFYYFESTWLEDVFKIRYLFNNSTIFVLRQYSDVKDMKKLFSFESLQFKLLARSVIIRNVYEYFQSTFEIF
jgi:hypothetical protein